VSELAELRRDRARLLALSCSAVRYVGRTVTNMATEPAGMVQSSYWCYGRSKVTQGTVRCNNYRIASRRKKNNAYIHTYIIRTERQIDRQTDRQTVCYLNNSSSVSSYPYKHRLLFTEGVK
jgi:hypothetical protein